MCLIFVLKDLPRWLTIALRSFVDASANQTERPLVVVVSTVDEIAPFWAPGSALSLMWNDEGRLDVYWPEAGFDVGIAGYSLSVNTSEPIALGNVTHTSLSAYQLVKTT